MKVPITDWIWSTSAMLRTSIAYIWVSVAVFVVVAYAILHIFVMTSFLELEQQSTLNNIGRVRDAIAAQTESLSAKASDWAAWNDAYEFVQDGNEAFIRSNIVLSAFTGNNLNVIAYTRGVGDIVYARWHQPGSGTIVPIPEDVRRTIDRNGLLTTHRGVSDSVSGVVVVEQGPMLIASRPVVTSNEEGPIRGALIFGRLFDEDEVINLSRITRVLFSIEYLDSDLPADFAQARDEISATGQDFVTPVSRNEVLGYTILDDIYGDPALILQVQMPRTIYNRGLDLANYALAALTVLAILFASVGSLLLARTVRKEREFDARTSEFYRNTIEAATGGKLTICERACIPITGALLGQWEVVAAEDVSRTRAQVTEVARREGMEESLLDDFAICVGESITNAVKHGGGGTASLYRNDNGLLLAVSDGGPGIDALAFPELALKPRYTTIASLGVGYKMMLSLADKVYLTTGPTGTLVGIEKRLSKLPLEEEEYRIPDTWNAA